jgi:pimeloyl-ACP methyl ester carboxylesterase
MPVTRRQTFQLFTAALAGATGVASSGHAAQRDGWPGLHVMGGRKAYVDTPMGQVHYRVMGEGAPLMLLHQTPWFSIQFAKAQPLLAAAGIQTIAIDTPGFGFSDLPAEQPSIETYADNLPYVLDALGLEQAAVVGYHTGASIAAAFAHRHPTRTACLIMDGAPLYTEEERRERLARPDWDQTLKPDGSHLTDRFSYLRKVTRNEAAIESVNWGVLSLFLSAEGEHQGHVAAFSYDMAPANREITAPALIIY